MPSTYNLDVEAGASIIGDDTQPSLSLDNSSTGYSLKVSRTTANATIAPLQLAPTGTASVPALDITTGGYASITSVVLTTVANTDYAIRVWVAGQPRWIPCFKDAAVIGAAAVA